MKSKFHFNLYIFFASYFFLLLLASRNKDENQFWITGYVKFLELNSICISKKNCLQSKFQLTLYPLNDTIINRIDFLNIENITTENKLYFSTYFENISENDLSISLIILGINSLYNISTVCDASNMIQSFWSNSTNINTTNVILKGECSKVSIILEKKLQKCFWCTNKTTVIEKYNYWKHSNFTIFISFEYVLIILIVIVSMFFIIITILLILLIKDKFSNNICVNMKDYKIQNYNITMTTNSKSNKLFFKNSFKKSSKNDTKNDISTKHTIIDVTPFSKDHSLNHHLPKFLKKSQISKSNKCLQNFVLNDKELLPNVRLNESLKSNTLRVESWINYREMWNTPLTKFNETGTSLFGGAVGYSDSPNSNINMLKKYYHY